MREQVPTTLRLARIFSTSSSMAIRWRKSPRSWKMSIIIITRVTCKKSVYSKMHREGFEPSSVATSHLECDPLDRSGICAHWYLQHSFLFLEIKQFSWFMLKNILSCPWNQVKKLLKEYHKSKNSSLFSQTSHGSSSRKEFPIDFILCLLVLNWIPLPIFSLRLWICFFLDYISTYLSVFLLGRIIAGLFIFI